MKKDEGARVTILMPAAMKEFFERLATENWSSVSNEMVRALKARMDAAAEQAKAAEQQRAVG
jgi:hypothetical protein